MFKKLSVELGPESLKIIKKGGMKKLKQYRAWERALEEYYVPAEKRTTYKGIYTFNTYNRYSPRYKPREANIMFTGNKFRIYLDTDSKTLKSNEVIKRTKEVSGVLIYENSYEIVFRQSSFDGCIIAFLFQIRKNKYVHIGFEHFYEFETTEPINSVYALEDDIIYGITDNYIYMLSHKNLPSDYKSGHPSYCPQRYKITDIDIDEYGEFDNAGELVKRKDLASQDIMRMDTRNTLHDRRMYRNIHDYGYYRDRGRWASFKDDVEVYRDKSK